MFLFENVKGLLTHDKGRTYSTIINIFEQTGYTIQRQVLNAWNYGVPPGGYWRDIDPEIAKSYMKSCWNMGGGRTGILRKMSLDEPSLTVLTSPSQKQTERCHPLEARPFTVRENARLQTFPDSWDFCGNVSSQYKQVGNAVPVNLSYEISMELYLALGGLQ